MVTVKINFSPLAGALDKLEEFVDGLEDAELLGPEVEDIIFESNRQQILGLDGPPYSEEYRDRKERLEKAGKLAGGPDDFDIATGRLFDAAVGDPDKKRDLKISRDGNELEIRIGVPYAGIVQSGPRPFSNITASDEQKIADAYEEAVEEFKEKIFK